MTRYFNFSVATGLVRSAALAAVLAASSIGAVIASPINVNTATQSELKSIKGIGPSRPRPLLLSVWMVVIFKMPTICKKGFVALA